MKPLAIIPARAGSKRLPGKNVRELGGQALMTLTVDCAYETCLFGSNILVTSDYPWSDIARLAAPALIVERPPELAQDGTLMMDVVHHAVRQIRADIPENDFDTVVLLQPTSPLRTAADVRAALELMEERHGDGVISVTHVEAPELFTIGHAQRLRPIQDGGDRRLVAPNGAIYAITTEALNAGLDWWTASGVYAYEMPPERSVDIDTIADFEEAERLWAARTL